MPKQTDRPTRSRCGWTPGEDDSLRTHYADRTIALEHIAAVLHRTVPAVSQRAGQLGLTRGNSTPAGRGGRSGGAYLPEDAVEQLVDGHDRVRAALNHAVGNGSGLTPPIIEMVCGVLDRADETLIGCL